MAPLTWTALAPLLRRPEWNERTAHAAFWGSDDPRQRTSATARFHTVVERTCRSAYAKVSHTATCEAEDVYFGVLVLLWDRCAKHRGLKDPSEAHGHPEAWLVTVVKNAALDVLKKETGKPSTKQGREQAAQVLRFEEDFQKRHGCRPSARIVADEFGVSVEDVHAWRAAGAGTFVVLGAPSGKDEDGAVFEIGADDDPVTQADARRTYESLATRIRDDHRVVPHRRLALACLSYPELVTSSVIVEAVERSKKPSGLLRGVEETIALLACWKELLPTLEGDDSNGVIAWILRSDMPLVAADSGEAPPRTLYRSFERWAVTSPVDAGRARDCVRKWQDHCKRDFGMSENDA